MWVAQCAACMCKPLDWATCSAHKYVQAGIGTLFLNTPDCSLLCCGKTMQLPVLWRAKPVLAQGPTFTLLGARAVTPALVASYHSLQVNSMAAMSMPRCNRRTRFNTHDGIMSHNPLPCGSPSVSMDPIDAAIIAIASGTSSCRLLLATDPTARCWPTASRCGPREAVGSSRHFSNNCRCNTCVRTQGRLPAGAARAAEQR